MQIRSVIFDFGNVITLPPAEEKIARAAADSGLPVDTFVNALWTYRLPYDAGMEPHDYWTKVASHAGTTFDKAMIARMIEHEIGFWNTFDPRVLAWINQLRGAGLKIGLLSNLPSPIGESLRATDGFLEHFDHHTFSYELRLVKPQKEIYLHALEGVGGDPHEALFIDDRPENIEGARQTGLHAELFTTWESFAPEIPARYGLPAPAPVVALRQ